MVINNNLCIIISNTVQHCGIKVIRRQKSHIIDRILEQKADCVAKRTQNVKSKTS